MDFQVLLVNPCEEATLSFNQEILSMATISNTIPLGPKTIVLRQEDVSSTETDASCPVIDY